MGLDHGSITTGTDNGVANLICRGNLGLKHDRRESRSENLHMSGRRPDHEVQFWTCEASFVHNARVPESGKNYVPLVSL